MLQLKNRNKKVNKIKKNMVIEKYQTLFPILYLTIFLLIYKMNTDD